MSAPPIAIFKDRDLGKVKARIVACCETNFWLEPIWTERTGYDVKDVCDYVKPRSWFVPAGPYLLERRP